MDDLLDDLNEQQRTAVTHAGAPLLVLAGPGSGKTRVLTRRMAYRIRSDGLRAERVLGITFTNRAAQEMKERVAHLLGGSAPVRLGTFHWMCNAILRRHAHRIGRRRDFRLLGESEARHVLWQAVSAETFGNEVRLGTLAAAISARKNGAPMSAAAEHNLVPAEVLVSTIRAYQRQLAAVNALDLDDLLFLTVTLLEQDERARQTCRDAYDEILVDEYQDVNPVQHQIVRLLTSHTGNAVAVGDEDQAIYGWRQADVRSILRFMADFPGVSVVKLEESYRSTKWILRAASSVVRQNRDRIGKRIYTRNPAGERPFCVVAGDEIEEAEWVASEVEQLAEKEGRPWEDFAVLYRLNAQSRPLEDALVRHNIPYHVHAGRRFYNRPEVRQVVAYLRLALDPSDDGATSLLLEAVPGIGPKRVAALGSAARARSLGLLDLLSLPGDIQGLPGHIAPSVRRLAARIQSVHAERERSLDRVLDAAIEASLSELDAFPFDLEAARDSLEELRSVLRELDIRQATLRGIADRLALGDHRSERRSGVRLMSLHAAKGLEFPVVFLPGLEDGILPHRRALEDEQELEEERRLCFVGMTRAMERLYLSYAHSRMLRGNLLAGHPSRFLGEIGQPQLSVRVLQRASVKPRLDHVLPGERVMHARWKAGTVLEVQGAGRDTVVTILFDCVGRQRLQLCHAPLSRLEEGTDALAG